MLTQAMDAAGAVDRRSSRALSVTTPDDVPDSELMQRLCARDLAALEALYDRHHCVALSLASRILRDRGAAEDVVQDAFLTLWRQPERFDASRGTTRGWLLAIVHHRSIDKLRRKSHASRTVALTVDLVDTTTADPGDLAIADQLREHIRAALDRLPIDQRRTIELAYLQGRTHMEIAQLMNCPLGTVKGRIRIGLDKLRTMIPAQDFAAA